MAPRTRSQKPTTTNIVATSESSSQATEDNNTPPAIDPHENQYIAHYAAEHFCTPRKGLEERYGMFPQAGDLGIEERKRKKGRAGERVLSTPESAMDD